MVKSRRVMECDDKAAAAAMINTTSDLLIEWTKEAVKSVTKTTTKPRKMHSAIEEATNLVDQDVQDQQKMKSFYQFVRNFKNGLEHENVELPKLELFRKMLETKLDGLNQVNPSVTD